MLQAICVCMCVVCLVVVVGGERGIDNFWNCVMYIDTMRVNTTTNAWFSSIAMARGVPVKLQPLPTTACVEWAWHTMPRLEVRPWHCVSRAGTLCSSTNRPKLNNSRPIKFQRKSLWTIHVPLSDFPLTDQPGTSTMNLSFTFARYLNTFVLMHQVLWIARTRFQYVKQGRGQTGRFGLGRELIPSPSALSPAPFISESLDQTKQFHPGQVTIKIHSYQEKLIHHVVSYSNCSKSKAQNTSGSISCRQTEIGLK